jgi:hypothetical protein
MASRPSLTYRRNPAYGFRAEVAPFPDDHWGKIRFDRSSRNVSIRSRIGTDSGWRSTGRAAAVKSRARSSIAYPCRISSRIGFAGRG